MFQRILTKPYDILFKYNIFSYARHYAKWGSTTIHPLLTKIYPQCT